MNDYRIDFGRSRCRIGIDRSSAGRNELNFSQPVIISYKCNGCDGNIRNIKKFILSFGKGFTFIGNQHRLVIDGEEFFVDLLFYNRPLRAMVAIDMKTGKFKPEYAGKMNFYLTALDGHEILQK